MNSLLQRAERHVLRLLREQLSPELWYHNLNHTVSVVAAVRTLAADAAVSDSDREQLVLAAWFHDTGFVRCYDGHEAASQALLEDFLEAENLPRDHVDPALIAVTHKGAVPYDLCTRLLKDADLNNLGSANYFQVTRNLRHELNHFKQQSYTDGEWHRHCVGFLRAHRYYSAAGRARYAAQKAAHLEQLLG